MPAACVMSRVAHPLPASGPMTPEYLTPQEVAAMLQVKSTKTVFRMAAADPTMPVLRINAQTIRFPAERLRRWLQQREGGRPAHKSAHGGLDGRGGGVAG